MRFPFRFRLLIFSVALLLVVQGVNYITVVTATKKRVLETATDELVVAESVFDRFIQYRANLAATTASVSLEDFSLKKVLASSDLETKASVVDNLHYRIGTDWAMFMDIDGAVEVVSSDPPLAAGDAFPFPDMIENAEIADEGSTSGVGAIDGSLHFMILIAIDSPGTLGYFVAGYELGQAFLSDTVGQLAIGVQASLLQFASGDLADTDGLAEPENLGVTVSQLDDTAVADLWRQLDGIMASPDAVMALNLAKEPMALAALPLVPADTRQPVSIIFNYSLEKALEKSRPLFLSLIGFFAIALMFAAIGAYFLAFGLSRPIIDLTRIAQKVREGTYDEVPKVERSDEFGVLSETFGTMIDRVQEREAKLSFLARFDTVTELPNRLEFQKRMTARLSDSQDKKVTILLGALKVVSLEQINYVLGRRIGNCLLKEIAVRLEKISVRESTIARVDENIFAIAIELTDDQDVQEAGNQIVSIIEEPFEVLEYVLDVYCKMGVVSAGEGKSASADEALQQAEAALHRANVSQADLVVFDADLDAPDTALLTLMNEMRQGLEQGEIMLYLQPKIDVASGRAVHAEGLVRWHHKERGFIPPDKFIPLAEQTGRIHMLTDWVLKTAVETVCDWREKGFDTILAVNLSVKDLADTSLPDRFGALLHNASLGPSDIALEITESALMDDPEEASKVLHRLHDMDITLTIDDFGTGYSSLAYLRRLPVSEIKIDQSFVRHLKTREEDRVITRATVELGHRLGLKVTAEGVEDEESLSLLAEFGCDTAQGYFISPPVDQARFLQFLETSPFGAKKRVATEPLAGV